MQGNVTLLIGILWAGIHLTAPAAAADFQTEDSIAAAAQDFLLQTGAIPAGARVDVGPLDSRMRLPACQNPLMVQSASVVANSARQLLNVRCAAQATPWSIYVPATLHMQQSVAVLARPVAINTLLTNADIRMELRDTAQLSGSYFTTIEAVVGKTLALQLNPGFPIPQNAIREPLAIRRGQTVTLVSAGSGIQVATAGIALSNATSGQLLRVKNMSSKRVIEGVVTAPGVVTVGE